mgnify:CR=1 FL=1|jgi:uncharacterized protein (TIGR01777 family)
MDRYRRTSVINASRDTVFNWHTRQGAFQRLGPPWQPTRLVDRTGAGLETGTRIVLSVKVGPFWRQWVAEHGRYEPPRMFSDRQVKGPFAFWEHQHHFETKTDAKMVLVDDVRYELPFGWLGRLGTGYARREIDRLFAYRHRVTAFDTALLSRYRSKSMKVAITGATGLIGSALTPFLQSGGHSVVPLRRLGGDVQAGTSGWDPATGDITPDASEGLDAVVHLAGENIASGRWNEARKARIRDSRVGPTRRLAEALARQNPKLKTLVVASAIGYYGDRGTERLNEDSPSGPGFLPEVSEAWEASTEVAREAGIRVVHLRIGIVLSPAGGALGQMLLPFKMGVGGKIGSGNQYMSWVALDDVLGAVTHVLNTEDLSGPVNVVAPNAVTNTEFTKTLGKVLGRPTVFPVPQFAARLVFGEMADALLLASTNVEPKRLQDSSFRFGYPTLEAALRHVLGR